MSVNLIATPKLPSLGLKHFSVEETLHDCLIITIQFGIFAFTYMYLFELDAGVHVIFNAVIMSEKQGVCQVYSSKESCFCCYRRCICYIR